MPKNTTPLIQECLPPLFSPNSRYPTKRTFVHYNCNKTFFTQSFFPFTIKLWDSLDRNLKGLDLNEFKSKIKEIFRPPPNTAKHRQTPPNTAKQPPSPSPP